MPTNLYGTIPPNWEAAFGGTPSVPSPGGSATSAIQANLGNLGSLYGLAGNLNQFQTAQAARQYGANLPGYQTMIDQSSSNIGAGLRGELNADVVSQILQNRREGAVGSGRTDPMDPAANAAFLRAIGLSSYGVQQDAERNLTTAVGRTPTAPLFDPTRGFVSPEQWQEAQTAANLYSSAPNPGAASRAAEAAANRGIVAGAGAVGGGARSPVGSGWTSPSTGWWGGGDNQTVLNSTGTGSYYNGIYREDNQRDFTTNDWLSSIGLGGGTRAGTSYGAGDVGQSLNYGLGALGEGMSWLLGDTSGMTAGLPPSGGGTYMGAMTPDTSGAGGGYSYFGDAPWGGLGDVVDWFYGDDFGG